jgi:hypothetical protein
VEDQDKRTEEEADVEAHRKKHEFMGSEDSPKDEAEEGEDFELHSKRGHQAL